MHEESSTRRKVDDDVHEGAVPAYLLDRENTTRAKVRCFCNLKILVLSADISYNVYKSEITLFIGS